MGSRLFNLPHDSPSQSSFTSDRGSPADGIFSSPGSTPRADAADRSRMFAGATPAASVRTQASVFSGFGQHPKIGKLPRLGGPRRSTARSSHASNGLLSSDLPESDVEGSPQIYEDDSRGEVTMQDDDDTGAYGDEEDLEDTVQDDTIESNLVTKRIAYETGVKPAVKEPGSLIIRVEELMSELYEMTSPERPNPDDEDGMEVDEIPVSLETTQEFVGRSSKLFLSSLQEHLPKMKRTKTDHNLWDAWKVTTLLLPLRHSTANTTEVLRRWLTTHAPNPTPRELSSLKSFHPNYVYSPHLWDIVHRLVLRGEVHEASNLLQNARWDLLSKDAPAVSQAPFGSDQAQPSTDRYTRDDISAIKHAVSTAVKLLRSCPGKGRSSYQPSIGAFPDINPDSDSPGSPADWRLWRGQVLKALEELKGTPDADYLEEEETESSIIASNAHGGYGISFYRSARQSKSKVPSRIARTLKSMYEIMHGNRFVIRQTTEDWQENVISIMMWGREVDDVSDTEEYEEDEAFNAVDVESGDYLIILQRRKQREAKRLSSAVEEVIQDKTLDPTDPIELAIGGVMANDVDVVKEISDLSLLVASAVVEIGTAAGWVPREVTEKTTGLMQDFNDEELAVLRMATGQQDNPGCDMENILRLYASSLFGTEWIDHGKDIEGWEVGVGVLRRIKEGRKLAGKLLTDLTLVSVERVDKLLRHCEESDLEESSSQIAFSWARELLKSSPDTYGDILHYLSLASHIPTARLEMHKLVFSLLNRTLTSSTPYPSRRDLDPKLAEFLQSPASVTSGVLRYELSGYGALRSFYDTRDSDPAAAAIALVAVIRSGGESIDRGKWDKEWIAPVEPMILPGLFKELVSMAKYINEAQTLQVLKVATDLEAAGEELWKKTEEAWQECKGSWVDVGDAGVASVVRELRLTLCRVLAREWVQGSSKLFGV